MKPRGRREKTSKRRRPKRKPKPRPRSKPRRGMGAPKRVAKQRKKKAASKKTASKKAASKKAASKKTASKKAASKKAAIARPASQFGRAAEALEREVRRLRLARGRLERRLTAAVQEIGILRQFEIRTQGLEAELARREAEIERLRRDRDERSPAIEIAVPPS